MSQAYQLFAKSETWDNLFVLGYIYFNIRYVDIVSIQ